jgi:hypothetical protein
VERYKTPIGTSLKTKELENSTVWFSDLFEVGEGCAQRVHCNAKTI